MPTCAITKGLYVVMRGQGLAPKAWCAGVYWLVCLGVLVAEMHQQVYCWACRKDNESTELLGKVHVNRRRWEGYLSFLVRRAQAALEVEWRVCVWWSLPCISQWALNLVCWTKSCLVLSEEAQKGGAVHLTWSPIPLLRSLWPEHSEALHW